MGKRWMVMLAALCLIPSIASARNPLLAGRGPPRAEAERPDAACAAFGPGFRKLEGSETCVKLGGSVRVETGVGVGGSTFDPAGR